MRVMDKAYCKVLEDEVKYLLLTAGHQSTRQGILTLLRNRAAHWRNQRDLATRSDVRPQGASRPNRRDVP